MEDADLAVVDSESSLHLPPPRGVGGTFAAGDPWDYVPIADVGDRDPAVAGKDRRGPRSSAISSIDVDDDWSPEATAAILSATFRR